MSAKNDKQKDKKSDEVIDRKPKFFVKTAADLQKLRLEKLMKNPNKQIIIPEKPRDKDFTNAVPVFVRNVMGSSAGAGSGEFHVYRNLRRKEYARLKTIDEKGKRERMDDDYHQKLEKNKQDADEKTAKKRAKRLKKKQNTKNKSKIKKTAITEQVCSDKDDESSENSDGDDENVVNKANSSQSDKETESECNEKDNHEESNVLIDKSDKITTADDKLSKSDGEATTESNKEITTNDLS